MTTHAGHAVDATTHHQCVLVLLAVLHALSPTEGGEEEEPAANEDVLGMRGRC